MGKRIIARARGKGSPTYRAPSHRYLGKVEFHPFSKVIGKVMDITHDPGRSAPVAIIRFEDGKELLHIAPEGLKVGDIIEYGGKVAVGNILPLSRIPIGTKIFCIENFPGSGPKFCRSSGTFALVVGKSEKYVTIQFPSGKTRRLNPNCRAMVGVAAGSGRIEKPWVKAGKRWHAMHARGKLYPRVKGVVMNPVDHPYGGKSHRPRPSKTVSRHAPPGAKVGSISPKRVGLKKGKR